MNNKNPLIAFSIALFFAAFLAAYSVAAENRPEIAFPVKELGNCASERDCRAYCDQPANISACVNFAEKHDLISAEEAARARAFAKMGVGPGGCRGREECETYCEEPNNIETCLNFAEKNDLIPPSESKEARQVIKALKSGAKLPGNCRGKKNCEIYCSEPGHMEECLAFAETAGFIPPEEIAEARKILPLMMRGEMPGGCRAKEDCERYCANETNIEECADFALKAGFIKPNEVELIKKTRGRGPGNCRGREECERFCNDPANQEICFSFAQEHGLIRPEETEKIREGVRRFKEGFSGAPPEVIECLKSNVGEEILEKIQGGSLTPGPQIGEQVKNCFERLMPLPETRPDREEATPGRSPIFIGPPVPGGLHPDFKGPGGCSSPEECKKYCFENKEKCVNWRPETQRPVFPVEPPGTPEPLCIQVVTPAKNPQTGACVNFPTPCAVPAGWIKIENLCENLIEPPKEFLPPKEVQSRLNPPDLKSFFFGLLYRFIPSF